MSLPIRIVKDHIVFPIPDPDRVKAVFPDVKLAPYGEQTLCAVPHTIDAVRFFENNGHSLPSPITSMYRWPGRFKPYAHQETTAEFLTKHRRCFCLNGLGTGKTKAALWGTDFLMKQGEVNKCLIVSPLSTLERVWAQEIFETLPGRRYRVLHAVGKGARDRRLKLLADPKADFYIINHDGLEIICDALKNRPDINHVIIDEVASFRSAQTKKNKLLYEILNRQGVDRSAWGMTGTPTPNAPTDCHGQLRLIMPEKHRISFRALQNMLMHQITQFKWIPKRNSADRVFEMMQPCIRFALDDCIDLPPTVYQTRQTDLSPEQRKHYERLRKEAMTEIGDDNMVTAVNAGVLLGKLCQAACGILYDSSGDIYELDFGPRLAVLKEVIEECDEKVIVFVPFTGMLDALYDHIKGSWTCAIVDGRTSSTKRNQIFSAFQNEENPRVLLANAGAMAHGLTLTAASTIVWYGPTTSNETFQQANARIVRPGQTQTTNIVMLQGTQAESGIYAALREKGRLQDVVLDLAKGAKK